MRDSSGPGRPWCMDSAEYYRRRGRQVAALLNEDEATSYGLAYALCRSFRSPHVETVFGSLIAVFGASGNIQSVIGGSSSAPS